MAVYGDAPDAILSSSSSGQGGGGSQYGTAPTANSIEEAKRLRRDDWIQKSDPNYWMQEWQRRASDPAEAGTVQSMLKYGGGSPEAWAKTQAETAKRMYANDLDRDADRGRNKRNFLIALAGMGALSAATSAGAFGGAAAGGAGAGTAGAGATGTAAGGGLSAATVPTLSVAPAGGGLAAYTPAAVAGGAGGAATIGGGAAAAGGGLTMATVPTISTGAAGAGGLAAYTPTAVAGGSTATVGGAGAGLGAYGKYANAALQAANSYQSAKEQEKLAKEAAKGKTGTTKRTPYYNEAISVLARYLLEEAARVYGSRQGVYGFTPGNYSPFAALLAQIPRNHPGV